MILYATQVRDAMMLLKRDYDVLRIHRSAATQRQHNRRQVSYICLSKHVGINESVTTTGIFMLDQKR